jgi:hypothetical protein
MVDAKLVRQPLAANGGAPAPPAPVGVPSTIVDQLTTFIPTETITLYVAYLAALGAISIPSGQHIWNVDFTSRWIGVAGFALVSSLLAIGLTYGKARQSQRVFTWPIFELITAPVAFAAWAVALPDTPLSAFKGYRVEIGAFIVLSVTVALAVIAWIFGKAPDYQKVVS